MAGIGYPDELAEAAALAEAGTHEGTHATQGYGDFSEKKKGKDGKYINQHKNGKVKDYNDRSHEKEAFDAQEKTSKEYDELYKKQ